MDITSNNMNQNQINQNNSYNNTNYQTTNIDNNYMNGNKGGTPYTGNMVTQPNGNIVQPSPPQYIPQNRCRIFNILLSNQIFKIKMKKNLFY